MSTIKTIIIATKNKGKVKELMHEFAGLPIEIKSLAELGELPDAVEDGTTFAENAYIKAKFYAEKTGIACIADDSGLEIDALNKQPGVYSSRFAGEMATDKTNNEKMVAELQKKQLDRSTARFKCALVFYDINSKVLQSEGACEGVIRLIPQGSNGFGYDPYFYLPDRDKTMSELSIEEKNKISHRGKAVKKMKDLLAGYLS